MIEVKQKRRRKVEIGVKNQRCRRQNQLQILNVVIMMKSVDWIEMGGGVGVGGCALGWSIQTLCESD